MAETRPKHQLYTTWIMMRQRCNNPKATNYRWYGARGIKVCERWNSFTKFVEDMGDRPIDHTLDRIDASKDYEPSNCRWATKDEQIENQHRNKREILSLRIAIPMDLQVSTVAAILSDLKASHVDVVAKKYELQSNQVVGISKHYR